MEIFFGLMVLLLFFMIFLGMDVALSMGSASLIILVILRGIENIPYDMISQRFLYGINNFTLLAIPFFLFAGQLCNELKVTHKIFNFANSIIGKWRGGLAHANVIASIIFAGMSGSAVADAGGLGQIEIEGMTKGGYSTEFSAAVTGASSTIGPIIPPSIPMVIYGALSGASITRLFIGGILPGLLMGFGLIITILILVSLKNTKLKVFSNNEKSNGYESLPFFINLKKAFLPLLTPIILILGIISGYFTPTEAAAVAILYVIILGFLFKNITFTGFIKVLKNTVIDTSIILFIVAASSIYTWILARYQVTDVLSEILPEIIKNPTLLLFVLVLILLIIGFFLDPTPALFILTPIFVPLVQQYNIDIIHFGIIMILTLMIGLITPPVGTVLYTLQKVTKIPFEKIVSAIFPFYFPLVIVVVLIVFFPNIVMFLPNLLMG